MAVRNAPHLAARSPLDPWDEEKLLALRYSSGGPELAVAWVCRAFPEHLTLLGGVGGNRPDAATLEVGLVWSSLLPSTADGRPSVPGGYCGRVPQASVGASSSRRCDRGP